MDMFDYTLLMIDGQPVSEIYLSEMIKAGYPPKNIVLIKPKIRNKKSILISKIIGKKNALDLLRFYSRLRVKPVKIHYQDIIEKVISVQKFSFQDLQKIKRDFKRLKGVTIYADSINSLEVVEYLKANIEGMILTAGGGILRDEILSLKKIRFINIHSGLVPEYKGSDNFFYSLIYGDTPGCSIFYIDKGIDTGGIIYKTKTPITLRDKGLEIFNKSEVFLTIKGYIIPYLKIKAFIEYIDINKDNQSFDIMNLPTESQQTSAGRTFYSMHHLFRDAMIEKIIL